MKEKHETILKMIAANITRIRKSKELTKQALADLTSIHRSNLSKIESGKVNLTVSTLIDLAEGLGVHPKKLMDYPS